MSCPATVQKHLTSGMIHPMRTRNLPFVPVVITLLTLACLPLDLYAQETASPHAHEAGSDQKAAASAKAPDFTLIDQDGKQFLSANLRGKIVVLDFIYTTCTDVCPLFTVNFVQLQRRLAPEHKREVFLVSITTDPEIDSPKIKNGVGPIQLSFSLEANKPTLLVIDLEVLDLTDHSGRSYELHINGYDHFRNGKLIDRVPPG